MTLELYNFAASTCSQKARICLQEKGLEWEDHLLEPGKGAHLRPEYLEINPNGVVPTLIHDGDPVVDSAVIVEYLNDVFPEPPLAPDEAIEIAKMRTWMRFFEEVPTPAVRYPSFQKVLIQPFKNISAEKFERAAEKRPLKTDFYKRMGQDGFSEEEMNKAFDDINITIKRMEKALSDGGPWIMGDRFTLADICVIPTFDRMADLGYQNLWEDGYPAFTDWVDRSLERPSVQKAFYQGSRFSDFHPELGLGRKKPAA